MEWRRGRPVSGHWVCEFHNIIITTVRFSTVSGWVQDWNPSFFHLHPYLINLHLRCSLWIFYTMYDESKYGSQFILMWAARPAHMQKKLLLNLKSKCVFLWLSWSPAEHKNGTKISLLDSAFKYIESHGSNDWNSNWNIESTDRLVQCQQ